MPSKPSNLEKSAEFASQAANSQLGPWLVGIAVTALGLGILTKEAALFVATVLFLVFGAIAWQLRDSRTTRESHVIAELQHALITYPQPYAPKNVSWNQLWTWAQQNPHLVQRGPVGDDESQRK